MVTDYLEGELPTEERAVLERHLALCDGCATYVDQIRETIRLSGTLKEEDVPAPIMEVLIDAFREVRGSG